MTEGTAAAPRVVMLTSNTVVGDSRVQKVAWSAGNAGFDAVVVGAAPGGRRLDDRIGAARVVRLPLGPAYLHAAGPAAAAARLARRGRHGLRRRLHRVAVPPGAEATGPAGVAGHAVWRTVVRDADWRRTQPQVVELERALLPEVLALRPALLHAHDYSTLGLAVTAADRLARQGTPTRVLYDAHELLSGVRGHDPVWRRSLLDLEAAAIHRADAVVTVSDRLADLLVAAHGLQERPTVVLNCPVAPEPGAAGASAGAGGVGTLRQRLRLPPKVPLLVYSGAVAPQRGLATLVEALPLLPGVHAAVVAAPGNRHVAPLRQLAVRLGVAERLHVTPYVAAADVTTFLADASVGVIPILHYPNHEIALITKWFEYVHAGLPILVSDVEEMARATRELGNGEVFPAGDAPGLARAARVILDNRERYVTTYHAAPLTKWTWQEQMTPLIGLYARLVGAQPSVPADQPAFSASGLRAPAVGEERA